MKDLAGIDLPKYFGNLNVEPEAATKEPSEAVVADVHKSEAKPEVIPPVEPTRPVSATKTVTPPTVGTMHKRTYSSVTHHI